jgi:site-specific DNA-methyltransferase (adenine-specific)
VTVRILQGDCRERMRELAPESFDAVVTDPPYEFGFMGRAWDRSGIAFDPATWAAVLRVMKPGAHLVAFGGSRTYHRLVCSIEDAGFEIRDQLLWVYGQGMPKATDKAKIPEAWKGWNTALKPALEPIVLARKPMVGTLAENLTRYGTGALNIEACRIEVEDRSYARNCSGDRGHDGTRSIDSTGSTDMRTGGGNAASGRWPANFMHDGSDEVVALFPAEAGAAAPGHTRNGDKFRGTYGAFKGNVDEQGSTFQGDAGSAARFFYCPKATRKDRDEGCDAFDKRPLNWSSGTQSPGTFQSPGTDKTARNPHPTVKPTELMRWLCKLVTPQGGSLLDPFGGSGSTGKAAALEGLNATLIELLGEHAEVAQARVNFALHVRQQMALIGEATT